jgi:acyl carrier protein
VGLDTVELVVAFENHFEVEIPDRAAEGMGTVGEVAAWMGQQLGTTGQRESTVRDTVAAQLRLALPATLAATAAEATPLLRLLPDRATQKQAAAQLLARAGLLLPILPQHETPAPTSWLARLFGSDRLLPRPSLGTSTLAELIDWTVALNYEKLLAPPYRSQYDVKQAVIGITADRSRVDVTEIRLSSSFTNDLGMD